MRTGILPMSKIVLASAGKYTAALLTSDIFRVLALALPKSTTSLGRRLTAGALFIAERRETMDLAREARSADKPSCRDPTER